MQKYACRVSGYIDIALSYPILNDSVEQLVYFSRQNFITPYNIQGWRHIAKGGAVAAVKSIYHCKFPLTSQSLLCQAKNVILLQFSLAAAERVFFSPLEFFIWEEPIC